jgi:hypothetical protein
MARSFISDLIGRLGLGVNPQTGNRVRTRPVPRDDWGNTSLVVEEKGPDGCWRRTGDVPGSNSGGHY